MKKFITAIVLAVLVGCASFSTNVFRTEQTLTGVAYGAYSTYTNALLSGTLKISANDSNSVRTARLQFAASVRTLELWRQAYDTNAATEAQLQSALDALQQNSSNFVFLIHLFSQP